jgi:4-azaleucine resistance transporter AzlC
MQIPTPPCPSARDELLGGVRAEAPLLLGVIPFGLIYGVLGLAAGLPGWAVVLMSSVVFGGSSQVVFAQLWAAATPPVILTATVGVVNARHALYSASLAPILRTLPLRWKLLLSYLLTDEAYAAAIARLRDGAPTPHRHYFLLGTGLTLWTGWQLSSLAGVLVGSAIPSSWSLDFSIPLTFIALLVMAARGRSEVVAALVAAATALALQGMPHKLWILVAAAAGMGAGWLLRSRKEGQA